MTQPTYPQPGYPQQPPGYLAAGIVTAKNPAVGGVLNGVWAGLGNVYAGQTLIGILLMAGTPLLWFLSAFFVTGVFIGVGTEETRTVAVVVAIMVAAAAFVAWIGMILWGVYAVRSFNRRNGISVR
jgi:hypothetical protein